MLKNYVFTNDEACLGCNKCMLKCPTRANNARFENQKNKVYVNGENCINCGECINICDHLARDYQDDTERFFADLERGTPITIVAAPAARTNFKDLENLFGYLKQQGTKQIYDVSYGADICTWGYIKAIKEQKLQTVIAQPCPVVVNYIEHFQPSLIKYLSPVQSPALCTAIFLNKYQNNTDKIAFLSPCVAKTCEFTDQNSGGYINYNVTYKKLIEYLKEKNINLNQYPPAKFDNPDGSFGFAFSRPGGLKENVHFYLGDQTWVTQVEGMEHIEHYFKEYEKNLQQNKPVPLLVDVLNCSYGCNLGTGTTKELTRDEIDYKTNNTKSKVDKNTVKELFDYFDNTLKLQDFLRKYENKSSDIKKHEDKNLNEIFTKLGKTTHQKQNINCFCCGYGSCHEFALAIANNQNHYKNCVHYLEESLSQGIVNFDDKFNELAIKLTNTNNKLKDFKKSAKDLQNISMQTKIISINASIESVHAGVAGRSFAIVASEIKRLAEMSSNVINKNTDETTKIIEEIQEINNYLDSIKAELHETMGGS